MVNVTWPAMIRVLCNCLLQVVCCYGWLLGMAQQRGLWRDGTTLIGNWCAMSRVYSRVRNPAYMLLFVLAVTTQWILSIILDVACIVACSTWGAKQIPAAQRHMTP